MKGQWRGLYDGLQKGKMVVNIDDEATCFGGICYLFPEDANLPRAITYFETGDRNDEANGVGYINYVDPRDGTQKKWSAIKEIYPAEIQAPDEALVRLRHVDGLLHVSAEVGGKVVVHGTLCKHCNEGKSSVVAPVMDWQDFKARVSMLLRRRFLFRGQQMPWSLRTSFHRRGRYRIGTFVTKDVRQLHQKLSGITGHYFNLEIPEQNGAFFNLLQHHGYPTPLLDWSYSPYVAAFFAFRGLPLGYSGEGVARIFMFNSYEWLRHFTQINNLDPTFLHLSINEFIAISNPRLVPQQAVTTATNIDNIEEYILEKEQETGVRFLEAIDVHARCREAAMDDLRYMGITAGSMFPGIEGICEELREQNFSN